jgi:glucosyl-3-phosphoglycerate synthase
MVTGMAARISTAWPAQQGPCLYADPITKLARMFGPSRVFHHRDVPARALVEAKQDHVVTLCLPAKDEAATIGAIVALVRRQLVERVPLVDEILVIDDGSADDTAAVAREAGARVERSTAILPELEPGTGKGEAMWKGLSAAGGDLVVWCDADITNFGPRFVTGLLGPLLTEPAVGFTKGFYDRPVDGMAGAGGRNTELVARPLIALLHPHLSGIVQPLSGEYGGRREVLEAVPFVQGYGVDLGLLIDVSARFGLGAIAQVDLGVRVHRNRSLDELSPQALAIMQTAFTKAHLGAIGSSATLLRPGLDPLAMEHVERPPLALQAREPRTA